MAVSELISVRVNLAMPDHFPYARVVGQRPAVWM